jgi:putative membrane protein
MEMRRKILAGLGMATLIVGIAAAQSRQSAHRMMRPDSGFMTKAAQGGIAEVEMGRLALQHGSNEKVKQFGQRMVDDHTNANDQLKQLASQKGVTLPSEVNAKQKSTINKLSQLSGPEFDRVYMADMVKDHQEDVAEFQHEANSGNDPDVKAFAGKVLPTLQDHLRMAEDARGQLNR